MKIGILTFHSQLNYGGVLQCWALKSAIENMGHTVRVLDWWWDEQNFALNQGYDRLGPKGTVKFLLRSLLGLRDWQHWVRVNRTRNFINKNLNITPYHFIDWNEAPKDLDIDAIVVGSDQVWFGGHWGSPWVFLLKDAPKIPAVAYAVSFGMTELPMFLSGSHAGELAKPLYEAGLSKFSFISCRESEGVELCRSLGYIARHVVDPTLLIPEIEWRNLVPRSRLKKSASKKKKLVCYFVAKGIEEYYSTIDKFARKTECEVQIFAARPCLMPVPLNYGKCVSWLKSIVQRFSNRICICDDAGPLEFVSSLAYADWIVSDSFHALMFSTQFNRNIRIVAPDTPGRKGMFSRISEFTKYWTGPVISQSLEKALASFSKGEKVWCNIDELKTWVIQSRDFLRKSLSKISV